MPRTIASEIGSRTLSIEDAADNWIAGTNALPNGHFGLAMGETPDTYSYAHDRVGDGAAYNFRTGQNRSINFWYRGVEQNAPYILGCGKQDSSAIGAALATGVNWMLYSSGNALLIGVSTSNGTISDAYLANANGSSGWRMITATWNPSFGTHGQLLAYMNGTLVTTLNLPNTIRTPDPSELSIGARATFSLSSLNPVATTVAPMELAKFAVFDTVLTAQNIADLYLAMQ